MDGKEYSDNQINDEITLDYMRNEVQKIIDSHFNDDNKFSVMNYSHKELNLLIDILTWHITREDLEKQHKKSERELKMVYDQIVCEHDFISALKNLAREIKSELKSLNADLSLEADLNELD